MVSHNLRDDIEKAVRFLREGKTVAFPTETVYGLGADASPCHVGLESIIVSLVGMSLTRAPAVRGKPGRVRQVSMSRQPPAYAGESRADNSRKNF